MWYLPLRNLNSILEAALCGTHFDYCRGHCGEFEECKGYVFIPSDNTCVIKSDCSELTESYAHNAYPKNGKGLEH